MLKVVWRFNLAEGVDETEYWEWLRRNVWSSSARYGCATTAYRIKEGPHAFSTEALWPSDDARTCWVESEDFSSIPNWPGADTPWAAASDMESAEYRPL